MLLIVFSALLLAICIFIPEEVLIGVIEQIKTWEIPGWNVGPEGYLP